MNMTEAPNAATVATPPPGAVSSCHLHPPLELAPLRSSSIAEETAMSTPSDDAKDEEQVMQRLYEARRRLETASDDMNDDSWLTPASMLLSPHQCMSGLISPTNRAQSPIGRPVSSQSGTRSSPNSSSLDPMRKRASRRLPTLTLDLKNLPYTALIDAERRRLSEASTDSPQTIQSPVKPVPEDTTTGKLAVDAASAPIPSVNSGSRYGIAPFMDLERGEWVWQCDVTRAPPNPMDDAGAPHAQPDNISTPLSSTKLTHAEEEWAWAVSGCAPMAPARD